MSRGKNLQEMETGTSQSKTAVNANAAAAEAPHKSATPVATPGQTGAWEDLGGPTPENSRPDDNSNTLKTPGATLKQVKDVVNAKAAAAEAPQTSATPVSTPGQGGGMKEEVEEDEDLVEEEETEATEEETEATEESEEGAEEVVEEDVDSIIEEDVNALLSGEEELSEEFKEKAKLVFEAALHAKTKEIQSVMEEHYATALAEEVEEIKLELTERVDSYLEYVSSEWLEENALAVESGLKTEITESFINGMKGLFEAHYVSMPEEKYDVLESMVEKLDEMETKLNEQIQRNIAPNKKLAESAADSIFNQVSHQSNACDLITKLIRIKRRCNNSRTAQILYQHLAVRLRLDQHCVRPPPPRWLDRHLIVIVPVIARHAASSALASFAKSISSSK